MTAASWAGGGEAGAPAHHSEYRRRGLGSLHAEDPRRSARQHPPRALWNGGHGGGGCCSRFEHAEFRGRHWNNRTRDRPVRSDGTAGPLPTDRDGVAAGVGKTFYCRAVAQAMSTTCVPIAINGTSDRGALGGLSAVWRGAKMGKIARGLLIDSVTAAPLFLLDELDKPPALIAGENTLDVLLSALEPENARSFVDEYLELPIALDSALWLASANDTRENPGPAPQPHDRGRRPQTDAGPSYAGSPRNRGNDPPDQ